MKLRNKEELEEKVMKNIFLGKALEYIFKKTGKVRNKTILEFGCGLGEMCVFFAFNGNHAIGVDLKEESINICQEYARLHKVEDTCHFIIGSSESMPVDTASIDIVFSRSSIQYMNHEKVISECLRVLKSSGSLILIENLPYNPFVIIYRLYRRLFAKTTAQREYVNSIRNYLTLKEVDGLRKMFLIVEHNEYHLFRIISIYLRLISKKQIVMILDRLLSKLDALFFYIFPFLKRFAWFTAVYCKNKIHDEYPAAVQ